MRIWKDKGKNMKPPKPRKIKKVEKFNNQSADLRKKVKPK